MCDSMNALLTMHPLLYFEGCRKDEDDKGCNPAALCFAKPFLETFCSLDNLPASCLPLMK